MKKSKFIIFLLTLNTFVIGLCEFVSSGITPNFAHDFNIKVSTSGLSTTLYATSVMIFAPLLVSITYKISRKKLLILVALNYAVANMICTFAPNFTILLLGRIMAGASHGLFMSIGTLVATQVSEKEKQGQAIALMFSGLTIATILGVPLGTVLANHVSWRLIFALITVLSVIIALLFNFLPNTLQKGQRVTLKSHKLLLTNKENLSALLLTAFGYGGVFVIYALISPLLLHLAPINKDIVTVILLVLGIFVAIGNIIGGKVTSKRTNQRLKVIFPLQIISYLMFYLVSHNIIILFFVVAIFGIMVFMNVSGLQLLNIEVSTKLNPKVIDITSSYNIAAFNLGIALGSFIGETGFDLYGFNSLPILASLVVLIAIIIQQVNKKLNVN